MNRRNFLQILAASGAFAATFDVEKLLWVPKPMIVVPELPKLYVPGNMWLERDGDLVGMVDRYGAIRYYASQYEVDKALAELYKSYTELENAMRWR